MIEVKSPITGIKYRWFGGHGIHGYLNKKEVIFFNTGDFSKDELTEEEARKKLEEIANAPPEEQAMYANTEETQRRIMKRAERIKRSKGVRA